MIKFEHDGLQVFRQSTCYRRYDGANVSKWNLKMNHLLFDELFKRRERMC